MSGTGKAKAFDPVRSAQEENVVLAFAESGYYHSTQPSLGHQVELLATAKGKVWSSYGLTLLDQALDSVS